MDDRAGPRLRHVQVLPVIAVAHLVPAPVNPRDPSCHRLLAGLRLWTHDEPRRAGFEREREAATVRRPGDLADRTIARRADRPRRAGLSIRTKRPDAQPGGVAIGPAVLRPSVVQVRLAERPSEGDGGAIGRYAQPRIAHRPGRQLEGLADPREGHEPQVRAVSVAVDEPAHDHGESPIPRDVVLLEHDLRADDGLGICPARHDVSVPAVSATALSPDPV